MWGVIVRTGALKHHPLRSRVIIFELGILSLKENINVLLGTVQTGATVLEYLQTSGLSSVSAISRYCCSIYCMSLFQHNVLPQVLRDRFVQTLGI